MAPVRTACPPFLLTLLLLLLQLSASAAGRFQDTNQEKFAGKLSDYDVVIPSEVDGSGKFISHRLTRERSQRRAHRQKRPELHFHVPLFGKKVHLQVTPNNHLLAPGFVSESGETLRRGHQNCHFVGQIKDQPGSHVAISTCKGLRGVIQTGDGETLFIEPIRGHNTTATGGQHPHLVYRRSALDEPRPSPSTTCDATDSTHVHDKLSMLHRMRFPFLEERYAHERRQKRSISTERHVEVLLVADKTMHEFYKEDLEEYLLSIMNKVTTIFRDPSIGNAINVVLVRLIILKEDQKDLKITHHADQTLTSFCKWSSRINPESETHPNHHDLAILVTRKDICKGINEPCGTLGLALINGLCTRDKSCNVNEDTGLTLAYTIAHEIGHNLGMMHDGDANSCEWSSSNPYLMSPLLQAIARENFWSSCSRDYVRRFLNKGWGWCLNDEPSKHDFKFPRMLPGLLYDADHQCRLMYGMSSSHCTSVAADVCRTLWCRVGNSCQSRMEPGAAGTACGLNKWCFNSRCVEREELPQSVDGAWGNWTEWSDCSRTCGGGVSFSHRHCNNPRPLHGGKYCIGEWKKYKLCNSEACPPGTPTFRQQQCTNHTRKKLSKRGWTWIPRFRNDRPCELHCKPKRFYSRYFSKKFSDQVLDGTPCYYEKRDVCINGKCEHVGCDNVLHSDAKEDRCGLCRGDGTSCETVKSIFNQTIGIGYVETAVIPKGARHIRVEEVTGTLNYLAARSSSGEYILNGNYFIQHGGEIQGCGTTLVYTRKHNKDTVAADGPLLDDLHVMLLFQTRNPGIKFEYIIPKNKTSTVERLVFEWHYRPWTQCSATCGIGVMRSEVECLESSSGTSVDDKYCNGTSRPDDKQKTCNEDPCPPTWWEGPWQTCSVSCGEGMSLRSVLCIQSIRNDEQKALSEDQCAGPKPRLYKPCSKAACPPSWTFTSWTPCSVTCGVGKQRRKVTCSGPAEKCDRKSKPIHKKVCTQPVCPTDTTKAPTSAPTTQPAILFPAFNHRGIFLGHPTTQCQGSHCQKWHKGDWSKCTTTCGAGTQTREVTCRSTKTNRPVTGCTKRKPATRRQCKSRKPCPSPSKSDEDCDESGRDVYFCKLVGLHKFCQFRHWRERCCKTCAGFR